MGSLTALAFSLALLSQAHGYVPDVARRQAASKFCDTGVANVCLAQYTTSSNIVIRVGIPEASAAPFDTLLQIVAPVAVGWAGIAWGGGMTANPLTVAWPNGNGAVVSSRWATYALTICMIPNYVC